jgi:hypothetical protein
MWRLMYTWRSFLDEISLIRIGRAQFLFSLLGKFMLFVAKNLISSNEVSP